jgi:hypothetical protein
VQLAKAIDDLMSSKNNYKLYRSELARVNENLKPEAPPILPYLGIYLRDLLYIDDGNPSVMDDGNLNYEKVNLIGSKLFEIRRYQLQKNLIIDDEDPFIVNYLTNIVAMDDELLFEVSSSMYPTNPDKISTRRSLNFQ